MQTLRLLLCMHILRVPLPYAPVLILAYINAQHTTTMEYVLAVPAGIHCMIFQTIIITIQVHLQEEVIEKFKFVKKTVVSAELTLIVSHVQAINTKNWIVPVVLIALHLIHTAQHVNPQAAVHALQIIRCPAQAAVLVQTRNIVHQEQVQALLVAQAIGQIAQRVIRQAV